MIQLPATLPAPSQEFSFGKEPTATRTQMESGNIRQRRTQLFNRFKASIKWELNPDEFDLFNQFLELEAAGGTAWFEAPLYTRSEVSPHKIRLINGTYQAAYQSWGGWTVTVEADLEKVETYGAVYYWMGKDAEENVYSLLLGLEKLVNIDLPNATEYLK